MRSARVLRTPTLTTRPSVFKTTYNDFRNTPYMHADMHIHIHVPLPQSFAVARTSEGRRRRRRRAVNTVNNRARAKWKKNEPVTYYSGPCARQNDNETNGKKKPLSYRSDGKRRRSTDAYVTCKYYIIVRDRRVSEFGGGANIVSGLTGARFTRRRR